MWSTWRRARTTPAPPEEHDVAGLERILRQPLAAAMGARPVVRRAPAEPALVAAQRVDDEARAVEPAVLERAAGPDVGRADLRRPRGAGRRRRRPGREESRARRACHARTPAPSPARAAPSRSHRRRRRGSRRRDGQALPRVEIRRVVVPQAEVAGDDLDPGARLAARAPRHADRARRRPPRRSGRATRRTRHRPAPPSAGRDGARRAASPGWPRACGRAVRARGAARGGTPAGRAASGTRRD